MSEKRITIKDVIVILLCLLALGALVYIVWQSSQREQQQLEELSQISEQLENQTQVYDTDEISTVLMVNEVNAQGWLEFYNMGKRSIDISGFSYAVDGVAVTGRPSTEMIDQDTFAVVDFTSTLALGTTQILTIYDDTGAVFKTLMIPVLEKQESYGSLEDGGVSKGYMDASRAASNAGSSVHEKDEMVFSVPGGFYNDYFELEIWAPEGWSVYYTLDGTTPTTESILYEAPITILNQSGSNIQYANAEGVYYANSFRVSSISMGTVVRALAVDGQGTEVDSETQSYFVGLSSSSDFLNMPVLSLTSDPVNFFDYYEGIYVTGRKREDALARGEDGGASANYYMDWTKPVHVEYFEPGKDKTFEGEFSISIIKNDVAVTLPQKSFTLTMEEAQLTTGSSILDYIAQETNVLTVQTNRRDNSYKLREYVAAELLRDSQVGVPDITPCIVFLDGEYWGVYMLRANYDAAYIEEQYGVSQDEVVIIRNNYSADTEWQDAYRAFVQFVVTADMSVTENYERVKAQMDVQSYLDYLCANMFLANANFGLDTRVVWRTTAEDGKWRYLMPQLDNSMANGETGGLTTSSIDSFLMPAVTEDAFFRSLLDSEEFKAQLLSTMQDMVDNVFEVSAVEDAVDTVAELMRRPALSSYRRFTGTPSDTFYANEVIKIKEFFQERGEYILLYTEEVVSGEGVWSEYAEADDAVPEGTDSIPVGESETVVDTEGDSAE